MKQLTCARPRFLNFGANKQQPYRDIVPALLGEFPPHEPSYGNTPMLVSPPSMVTTVPLV